jgi:regulator of sigma E protease
VSWLYTILGFAALVILHEFGHFAVAKAVGMRVERFSLGFGKPLISVRRGETEYGIGPIPLGGYVKITGMNPYELEQRPQSDEGGPQPTIGSRAAALALDSPQELPAEVKARAYYNQPVWKRIAVILAGPVMNIVVAFLILWVIFAWHGIDQVQPRVAQTLRNGAAASVLKPGDRVVAVDGRRGSAESLSAQVSTHHCPGTPVNGCQAATPAVVAIARDGRPLTFRIRPRYSAADRRVLLGFQYRDVVVPQSVGSSAHLAVSEMWSITSVTVSKVGQIFTSSSARKQVHGVVGTSDFLKQSFSYGVADAFFVLALISLSLAIINLFPFLPLDGGHIFWALVERVRGRAVPFAVMERASIVGIALVGFLFLVGFTNDVNTLSNGGFHVH